MKTKNYIKKCVCNYEIMPFASHLIDDAWVDKKNIAYFTFFCPNCNKKNIFKLSWDK